MYINTQHGNPLVQAEEKRKISFNKILPDTSHEWSVVSRPLPYVGCINEACVEANATNEPNAGRPGFVENCITCQPNCEAGI
jgi:hypothetical protein